MSKEIESHVLDIFEVSTFIGSGAYGHVWKVMHRPTGKYYALKKIFDAFQNDVDAQRTYREVSILHQLNHPNIVKLYWVIRAHNPRDIYLVFEWAEADLHSILGENILSNAHIRFIIYQLCKVLKYLHSAQLIHRDLKSSNILINSNCEIKLCDFGLVRSLVYEQDATLVLSEDVATRWYRSPELILGSRTYGKPTDIWSLGCILAELVNGQPLLPGNSNMDQVEKIIEFTGKPTVESLKVIEALNAQSIINQLQIKRRPLKSYFQNCDSQIQDIIIKMLQFNPEKRITSDQVLQLPCLQQFRGKSSEDVCHCLIMTAVDDNMRLGLEDYRRLIYKDIERRYPDVNKFTPLPRFYRAYHSIKSRSNPDPFHRVAVNSLVKVDRNTFMKRTVDSSCIEEHPANRIYRKQPKKVVQIDEKQNKQAQLHDGNAKIYKRKIRANLWNRVEPTPI